MARNSEFFQGDFLPFCKQTDKPPLRETSLEHFQLEQNDGSRLVPPDSKYPQLFAAGKHARRLRRHDSATFCDQPALSHDRTGCSSSTEHSRLLGPHPSEFNGTQPDFQRPGQLLRDQRSRAHSSSPA